MVNLIGQDDEGIDMTPKALLWILLSAAPWVSLGASDLKEREKLALYRGFYEEGKDLERLCLEGGFPTQNGRGDREALGLSFGATLQYIGLEVTSQAMAQYMTSLGRGQEEYENLVENLVGNFCSKNISVIGLKKLKRQMKLLFTQNSFELPSSESSPFFIIELDRLLPNNRVLERELKATIKLFQAFCSWGTVLGEYRAMGALAKNPVVAAFVIRHMAGQKLHYSPQEDKVLVMPNAQARGHECRGFICRRPPPPSPGAGAPKSGHIKAFYCQSIREGPREGPGHAPQGPMGVKLMKELTPEAQDLLVGQFVALVTRVPDFFFRIDQWSESLKLALFGLDLFWGQRLLKEREERKWPFAYEESLELEVVDRRRFLAPGGKNFQVRIDVNFGEFDRAVQQLGKLSASFEVPMSKGLVSWAQRSLFQGPKQREEIISRLARAIAPRVGQSQSKLKFAPWKEGLPRLVAVEFLNQLEYYQSTLGAPLFSTPQKGTMILPVTINYAPLSLRYIYEMGHGQETF